MKIRTILQFGIAVAALSLWAAANPVTLTVTSTGAGSPGGTAYYPYTIQVNHSGSDIEVACDDFTGHAAVGVDYTGWVSTYSDLSHALFNGGAVTPNDNYQDAAFLVSQLIPVPPATAVNEHNAALNWAIWQLFDSSAFSNAGFLADPTLVADATADLAAAESADLSNFDFSNFRVYSPVTCNVDNVCAPDSPGPQEFIGEVPEPASLALLGTGLLGLAFLFRRRLYHADGLDLQG